MSRIGRMPITVPAGTDVKIEGRIITVKGAKGTLTAEIHPNMTVEMKDNVITVARPDDTNINKALHGMTRANIANMVKGVSEGFQKNLEINGVGYRAQKDGKKLVMNLGYSHQVIMEEIPGITIEVPAPNQVIVKGADKQAVGQFAANIREKRPPEPYKGKGIKYLNETIIRKEGKAGGKKK